MVLCSPVFAAYVFISLVSIFVVECCENVFHQFFIHTNFCSFSGIQYCSSTTLCAVFAAHLPLSLCSHFHLGVFVKTAFMFSYSTKGPFHLFGPNEVSLLWHTVWNIFYSSLLSTALTLINRRKITVRKLSVQFFMETLR